MARYYRVNSLKQTLAEDWRLTRSWRVLLLWWLKLLRVKVAAETIHVAPDIAGRHRCTWDDLPEDERAQLRAAVEPFRSEGFAEPAILRLETLDRSVATCGAVTCSPDGRLVGTVHVATARSVQPPNVIVAHCLASRLADGRLVGASSLRQMYDGMPHERWTRVPGGTVPQLLAAHASHLAKEARGVPVVPVADVEDALASTQLHEEASMEDKLRRGLYEEVPEAEALGSREAEASAAAAGQEPADGVDAFEASVLSAIDEEQKPRTNWQNVLAVAVISLVLFVGLGGVTWDWRFATILAGVVLFHEAGHYVAMRAFGYRNMRMFFVPFLGAAVSGQNYNVPGWKKAIVALAGPVPGIVLGVPLLLVATVADAPLLREIAMLSFIINGLNLLPFVPLDGGWVLHAVLFQRHPMLDVAFKGAAVVAGAAATAFGLGKFWMFLAIVVAIGLPVAWQVARAAERLRVAGLDAASPDATTVPREIALRILRELRSTMKEAAHAKVFAQRVLSVFDRLNSRPPGVVASFLLLVLHAGAFAGAAAGGFGAVYLARGAAADLAEMEALIPMRHVVTSSQAWPEGAPLAPPVAGDVLVVAHGPSEDAARNLAQALIASVGEGERLTRFGETVLVATREDRTRTWTEAIAAAGARAESAATDHVFAELTCLPADDAAARELADTLAICFRYADGRVRPPWVAPVGVSAEDLAAQERAWAALRLQRRASAAARMAPEVRKARRRASLTSATGGDLERARTRYAELKEVERGVRERMRSEMVAAAPAGSLDEEIFPLVDAPGAMPADAENRQEQVARKIGRLEESDPAAVMLALWGNARDVEAHLQVEGLQVRRLDAGLPALSAWLRERGCGDQRYDIHVVTAGEDDADEAAPEEP